MQIAINEKLTNLRSINIPGVVIFKNLNDIPKSNTFFFSTPSDCHYLNSQMYGITKYFNLSVTNWLPFIKEKYLNYDGFFKLACQLGEDDIGYFCRANSGSKNLSGHVLKDIYDIMFVMSEVQDDTLLFLAKEKSITQEMRFWIVNEKIVAYSKYSLDNNIEEYYDYSLEEYEHFVKNICDDYQPDDMFILDIGLVNRELKVIEYNCFSTANFFNSDINNIVSATKDYFKD